MGFDAPMSLTPMSLTNVLYVLTPYQACQLAKWKVTVEYIKPWRDSHDCRPWTQTRLSTVWSHNSTGHPRTTTQKMKLLFI